MMLLSLMILLTARPASQALPSFQALTWRSVLAPSKENALKTKKS